MIITKEILHYNSLGIVPGPDESLDDFLARAKYCLALKRDFAGRMQEEAPFTPQNRASEEVIKEAFPLTERLYDIRPDWIPVFFSNYKLSFWHGGCAWIFQENDQTPMSAFFQLRRAFEKKHTYLGLYKRDELMAHEFAHVGRMMFEEIRFEEILAFRSDSSWFRRYLGPIMQSSLESALFVLVLLLVLLLDLSMANILSESLYQQMMWVKLVPFVMVLYALGRLILRQYQFSQCLKQLKRKCRNESQANAVAYRLTDQEIALFSQLSPEKILNYAFEKKKSSLRWAVICKAYLNDSNRCQ